MKKLAAVGLHTLQFDMRARVSFTLLALHLSSSAGAMLVFSVSFQLNWMIPNKKNPDMHA